MCIRDSLTILALAVFHVELDGRFAVVPDLSLIHISVLTYEEMAGLVLGYDPWELGLQMHQVDVEPLLEKMGVSYDPAAKYLGRNGKYIGKPEAAVVNSCAQDTVYNIKLQ